MRIVRPYAKIETLDLEPLKKIEFAARISHRSEDAMTEDSWERFIRAVVIGHGDWSVVEHAVASCDFYVDRGITHEVVRHRLFSFTQESTRFVNYEKKMPPSFIYPKPEVECTYCMAGYEPVLMASSDPGHTQPPKLGYFHECGNMPAPCEYDFNWLSAVIQCESHYKQLLTDGWRPQEARSVFPNALASRILITGNLRNWRHFFLMRTTKEAHPQMRQVTIPLLAEFKLRVPILFDDIEPLATQVENLKKAR